MDDSALANWRYPQVNINSHQPSCVNWAAKPFGGIS
jgi:hypothetical protein